MTLHSAELFMTIFQVGESRGYLWRGGGGGGGGVGGGGGWPQWCK